ncbi:MAG TPA: hypothetical protein VFY18_15480 [Candidatus Limnocylindrales bacterium]|nr:hypothetical protein [Candidatus Limnocylindrales bacterium]
MKYLQLVGPRTVTLYLSAATGQTGSATFTVVAADGDLESTLGEPV